MLLGIFPSHTSSSWSFFHSSFHGGDGGGDVGVGVAAAGFIFPCLYLAIFSTLYKRLKRNKGEDFIWAALAPCPILLVRETILFSLLTRLKWTPYAIVIYCYVYMYSHYRPIKYSKIKNQNGCHNVGVNIFFCKCVHRDYVFVDFECSLSKTTN